MKTKTLLFLSLFLNLLLAAAYVFKAAHVAQAAAPQALVPSTPTHLAPAVGKVTTNVITIFTPAAPFDWRTVESGDYRQYITNLRNLGCPEKTIRDIIIADVNDLYRQRAKAVTGTTNRFEYWRPGLLGNALDEQQVAKQQDLAKEKRELLKLLLGDAYADQADPAAAELISPMEQMTGDFLSPEKQTAMKALERKYANRQTKALKDVVEGRGDLMKTILAEKDAEMLAILTPEEKFEYDVRLSQPAMLLRLGLGQFEPTEQEFRDMFKATKNFTDRFGFNATVKPDDRGPAATAAQEMLDQFKAALGEQRFREYQQKHNQPVPNK